MHNRSKKQNKKYFNILRNMFLFPCREFDDNLDNSFTPKKQQQPS